MYNSPISYTTHLLAIIPQSVSCQSWLHVHEHTFFIKVEVIMLFYVTTYLKSIYQYYRIELSILYWSFKLPYTYIKPPF